MCAPIRVLAVTNLWPTAEDRVRGIFVWEQVEALRELGVHVDVEVVAQERGKADYLLAARRIRARARAGGYDLVHVHYGLTSLAALLAGSLPTVLSLYGSDVNVGWQRRLTGIGAKRADARIYVSQRLAEGAGDPEGSVIPCGVDLGLFTPMDREPARRRLGVAQHERVVLFGGHPANPVKGYPIFCAVLESLRRAGMPVRELILAAPGAERRDIPARFAAADVLLFTSLQGFEGSPGVVKEAVAMGLPVVTVNVGDVAEVLSGVSPSAVVEFPSDQGSLVAGLAAETAAVLVSGKRSDGRTRAKRYGWSESARKIVTVYTQVLMKHQTPSAVTIG